jgi:1,5-anhydro-D-fructose reductase (1,5-anhydro-D-mannitol-forming)
MRWGIIGYGWVARDHMAPAIRAAGGTLAAVADPCPAARAAATGTGATAYSSAEALIDYGGCDLVYVATPNHCHAAPVQASAAAGLPVLCEKPMAASLADAERMADTVLASRTLYGTAFDQRHHPAHRLIRQRVADGAIGRPVALRIAYACWVGRDWSPTGGVNWRADPDCAGGGAVMDLALHGLDLAEFLLGEPLVDLTVMLQRRVHDYPVEDGGVLTARSASGVLVSLHVAYNCPEALPRRRLELLGDAGQFTAIDTMGQTAGGQLFRTCGSSGAVEPVPFDGATSPFTAQAAAFIEAARGEPHDWSLTRDIRLMRLFDTAYREAQLCL